MQNILWSLFRAGLFVVRVFYFKRLCKMDGITNYHFFKRCSHIN